MLYSKGNKKRRWHLLNQARVLFLSVLFFMAISPNPGIAQTENPEEKKVLEDKDEDEDSAADAGINNNSEVPIAPEAEMQKNEGDGVNSSDISSEKTDGEQGNDIDIESGLNDEVSLNEVSLKDEESAGLTDMSLDELLNVTVSSTTKTDIRMSEAPSVVTVVTRSEIETYGYRTVGEALSTIPGLFVFDDFVTSNVAIRGISGGPDSWSRIVKVMIDGHPVTYYDTGGTLLGPELIPMDAVESIEVIRGPGSALYGGNAFLGVVNIITRAAAGANDEDGSPGGFLETAAMGGINFNRKFQLSGQAIGGASTGGKYPLSFIFSALGARFDRSGISVPPKSPRAEDYSGMQSRGDLSRPRSILVKAKWNMDLLGQFDALFLKQHLDAFAEFSPESILTHHNRRVLENQVMAANYTLRLARDLIRINAFGRWLTGESAPEQVLDSGGTNLHKRYRHSDSKQAGAEFGLFYKKNSLLLGGEYVLEDNRGGPVFQVPRESSNNTNWILQATSEPLHIQNGAAYLQLMAYPFSVLNVDLGFIFGLRYDHNTEWGDIFNFRAGAVYSILDNLTVKLLFGTSFVPPAAAQVNAVPIGNDTVKGNPDLESQTANTVELSLNYTYKSVLSLMLNSFVTAIDDRVEFFDNGLNLVATNWTSSLTFGGELAFKLQLAPLFAQGHFSLQSTTVEEPENPLTEWFQVFPKNDKEHPWLSTQPPGYPIWRSDVQLGVRLPDYFLEAALSCQLVGMRKSSVANIRAAGEDAYYLPTYAIFDLNIRTLNLRLIGDRLTEISVKFSNLFNAKYSNPGNLGVDIPGMPFTFFVTLKQHWI